MAIEITPGATVFTGEHVRLHQEAAATAALALEVNTGLGHSRGSLMQLANSISSRLDLAAMRAEGLDVPAHGLGFKRTKRGALADLTVYMLVVWNWNLLPSVRRALGDDLAAECERKAARIVKAIRPKP